MKNAKLGFREFHFLTLLGFSPHEQFFSDGGESTGTMPLINWGTFAFIGASRNRTCADQVSSLHR
jgi:hypothetical protein